MAKLKGEDFMLEEDYKHNCTIQDIIDEVEYVYNKLKDGLSDTYLDMFERVLKDPHIDDFIDFLTWFYVIMDEDIELAIDRIETHPPSATFSSYEW